MKRFFPVIPRDVPAKRQKDDDSVAEGLTGSAETTAHGADVIPQDASDKQDGSGGQLLSAAAPSEKLESDNVQNLASIFRRAKSFGGGTGDVPSTSGSEGTGRSPSSFMSWNTNSFIIRMKSNKQEVVRFVEQHDPDLIAIQEVSTDNLLNACKLP